MLIWSWEGGKNFRVGIWLDKNLLGYRVTGNKQLFFFWGGGGGGLNANVSIYQICVYAQKYTINHKKFSAIK